MTEELTISKGLSKKEQYEEILPQLKALVEYEKDTTANLANLVAALKYTFNFFWVGVYFVKEDELVLGPFQGPIACTRIQKGKGVCGTAWEEQKIINVPDVDAFPGHIACSSTTRSEIVLPVIKNGEVVLVLDIDSEEFNMFDHIDEKYLTKVGELIVSFFLKKMISYDSFFSYSILILVIFFYSCAQIVPLSGGEKDVTPPNAIHCTPLNKSINFNETTISIEFDEFIQLSNLNTQLVISPIIEPKPVIAIKGKKLIIQLTDSLLPNTTYSINFGNAITDITENNSIPNYKYVFSTGNFIDSLSYSGRVVNASSHEPQENIYVLLYHQHHDSVPYTDLPNYIALTDKDGKYEITNIAEGTYKLFALKDINNNYLYDLPNEKIGFYNNLIQLQTSQATNQINLFQEDYQKQYIKKISHKQYGKIDVVFNAPTYQLNITPLNLTPKDKWKIEEINEQKDSLTLWLTLKEKPSSLSLVFEDQNNIIDTSQIKLIKTLKDSILIINSNLSASFDLNLPVRFSANRPIVQLDTQQIHLLEDSLPVNFTFLNANNITKDLNLHYPFKENTDYTLLIPAKTMTDIYGLSNDSIIYSFRTKSAEDYGIIYLSLTPNIAEEYILQLYKDNKLVTQKTASGVIKTTYNYLLPGTYKLKLIVDTNKNGKWDTGNYLKQQQPEKIIIYQKEINIRANWDNEINWVINE